MFTNAATLQSLHGAPIDRVALISSVLFEVENLYELLCAGMVENIVALLRERECSRGKSVRVKVQGRELRGNGGRLRESWACTNTYTAGITIY